MRILLTKYPTLKLENRQNDRRFSVKVYDCTQCTLLWQRLTIDVFAVLPQLFSPCLTGFRLFIRSMAQAVRKLSRFLKKTLNSPDNKVETV